MKQIIPEETIEKNVTVITSMRIKSRELIVLFILAAAATGCGITSSVTATDLTQPVMLGKIKRLPGPAIEESFHRVPFEIEISNKRTDWWTAHRYAGNKAVPILMNLVETPADKIAVDEIYIGSYSLILASPNSAVEEEKAWADVRGAVYRAQAGSHEPE